jgi:glycosyltransferase involved in cell wall biosynthesis
MHGWARKVVEEFIQIFPEVEEIITLISDSKTLTVDWKIYAVHSVVPGWARQIFSFFAKRRVPFFSWLFDYRNLMPIYPLLVILMRKRVLKLWVDKVLISSFAIAKNMVKPGKQEPFESLLYLHSPMQYIHSHYDEYSQKLRWFTWRLFGKIHQRLLKRDLQPRKYDTVYTNSHYTAGLAKDLYQLESKIAYPAICKSFFDVKVSSRPATYRVATGRLVRLVKEFDRIVELFNTLEIPLLILWSWPDEAYLKSIAGSTITFLWWVGNDTERAEILRHAAWCINLTKESFWIATAEALLCGVPILWYNQGGTTELVDDQSGVLIAEKWLEKLLEWFHTFEEKDFVRQNIQDKAKEIFSDHITLL